MTIVRHAAPALLAAVAVAACEGPTTPSRELTPSAPSFATRASLTITTRDSVIAVGDSIRLETLASDGTNSSKNNANVYWASMDTTVATVRSPGGMVKGLKVGVSAIVAVYAWRNTANYDTLRIVVTATKATASPSAAPTPAVPDSTAKAQPQTPPAALPSTPPTATTGQATAPALPRATVDTRMPTASGRTLLVRAGGDLQAAIDSARFGDVIVLPAGETFTGAFKLTPKTGTGWIVITSNGRLPAPGTRIHPRDSAQLTKIRTRNLDPAFGGRPGTHGYRLVGLDIATTSGVARTNALVNFGVRSTDRAGMALTAFPRRLILDRSYVHGLPTQHLQRCVAMNAAEAAVIDSYLAECHAKGNDSQAILAYDTPGPLLIHNNYLEGAGENVMFGGANSGAADRMPSDITVTGNHFFKPLAWRESRQWTVKNLFEIKVGVRVLVEGNVFENNWTDAQTGRAILIRAADQESKAPWSRTSDITFRYNIVRYSNSGFSIDAQGKHESTRRVTIENNLVFDIGEKALGNGGDIYQITGRNPMQDIVINRNTAIHSITPTAVRGSAVEISGGKHERLVYTNNITQLGFYGLKGSGAAPGLATFARYSADGTMGGNVWVGTPQSSARYSADDRIVSSLTALGLPTTGQAGQMLSALSARTSAAAVGSAGADVAAVLQKTAGAIVQ